ncbi:MAG: nucleotide exchange factor GrpE [Xanthomonadales bacterium]|nr:nucleotide exchange factor GrpE [Xanthomonadales bacterium]
MKKSNTQADHEAEAQATTPEGEAADNAETSARQEQGAEDNADDEMQSLQSALGQAEQEVAETKEAMLRMHAEMENLRKRLIKDLERSRRRALEDIMNDLLPVKDSLERGVDTDEATTTVEAMKEGKALIIRMLGKVMSDHGLQELDPAGEPFDPELHQAMAMHETEEYEPGTVIEVMQKGFRLHDRLIRPAMVVVAKAPGDD